MEGTSWSPDVLGLDLVVRSIFLTRITVSILVLDEDHWLTIPSVSRHLLGIEKRGEARKVIADLNSVPEDDPLVDEIVEELDFGIRAENEGGKVSWLECFSTRNKLWKRTLNGMMLQFIQQLNGQNFYCKLIEYILD